MEIKVLQPGLFLLLLGDSQCPTASTASNDRGEPVMSQPLFNVRIVWLWLDCVLDIFRFKIFQDAFNFPLALDLQAELSGDLDVARLEMLRGKYVPSAVHLLGAKPVN